MPDLPKSDKKPLPVPPKPTQPTNPPVPKPKQDSAADYVKRFTK